MTRRVKDMPGVMIICRKKFSLLRRKLVQKEYRHLAKSELGFRKCLFGW